MKIETKFYLVAILLVSSLGAAGFVQANLSLSQDEQVITYGMPYDFSEYSQFTADSYATAQWVGAVMAGLYARDADANRDWNADLAAGAPTVSADGLTWTVDLKPGLKFATGGDLTAEDVVFSYQVALTPGINTNGYGLLSLYFAGNDSITAVDDDTVEFKLSTTYAFAQGLLSQGIIEKAEFGADYTACVDGNADACVWNDPTGEDARGAGPFVVESIDTTNNVVTLVKNANYHKAADVKAEKLVFKKIAEREAAISELGAGTIDIMDSQYVPSLSAFDGLTGVADLQIGDPAHQEISLNHLNPYFGTGAMTPNGDAEAALNVRKAMSHIVNRDNFVSEILEGLGAPAATVMPSASLGWDADLDARAYTVDGARDFMEAAGFDFADTDIDMNSSTSACDTDCFFEITVLSPNTNPARNQWSSAYVLELPKIGIKVTEHVSTGWDEIIPRSFGSSEKPPSYAEGGYDIFFVGYSWGLDWDPSGLYTDSGFCDTGDCSNFYNYDNDEIEQLIVDYTTELNFDERIEKVETLQAALHADIPVIPILYPQSNWGYRDDVTGVDWLLISSSLQEWAEISKSGWTATPDGVTLDARTGYSGGGDGGEDGAFLPFDAGFVALAIVSTSLIAMYRRRD